MNFNRPPALQLPDLAAWEAKTGCAPWKITDPGIVCFETRAKPLAETDWATLDEKEASRCQDVIDGLCMEIEAHFSDGWPVSFDPVENHFWVFPGGPEEPLYDNKSPLP